MTAGELRKVLETQFDDVLVLIKDADTDRLLHIVTIERHQHEEGRIILAGDYSHEYHYAESA